MFTINDIYIYFADIIQTSIKIIIGCPLKHNIFKTLLSEWLHSVGNTSAAALLKVYYVMLFLLKGGLPCIELLLAGIWLQQGTF